MVLTYRQRLLPSKRQHIALLWLCEQQRQLYNAALEERIDCYRKTGRSLSFVDQAKSLTVCRRELTEEMGALPLRLQRWTLKRLDDAFVGFFRRLKARDGCAGFPRFRNRNRWSSFGFDEFSGIRWDGKRLRFAGLPGGLRVHLHRSLPPKTDIRSCVFRRDGRGWYVGFQVAVAMMEKRVVRTAVGVDLGLKVFAHCSDGVILPNPHVARRVKQELRRRQRALARCKRGSNRRCKARERVARLHRKVINVRNTWLHQRSAELVSRADLIAVEDLNVKGMIRHPKLARSISDVGWSRFVAMLAYKAERAGAHLIRVDPRNTSQRCSGCGELVPKSLAVRTHACPSCGLTIDRDRNAARNILLAAVVGRGADNVTHRGERRPGNIGLVLAETLQGFR